MNNDEVKGQELQPHQQRVVDERKEVAEQHATVKERASKLNDFMEDNPMFAKLALDERADMMAQYDVMCKVQDGLEEYLQRLDSRINRF